MRDVDVAADIIQVHHIDVFVILVGEKEDRQLLVLQQIVHEFPDKIGETRLFEKGIIQFFVVIYMGKHLCPHITNVFHRLQMTAPGNDRVLHDIFHRFDLFVDDLVTEVVFILVVDIERLFGVAGFV